MFQGQLARLDDADRIVESCHQLAQKTRARVGVGIDDKHEVRARQREGSPEDPDG